MSSNQGSATLPLHEAVKNNDASEVQSLLAAKEVDPNLEDDNGVTALIEACIAGYEDIVRILLEAGCPAQPKEGFRHSPLRGATVAGQYHIIPVLLEAGADPNALSAGKRTPLMGCCFLRKSVEGDHATISLKCVREMLKDTRTDPTIANDFGETALDLAKSRGYEDSAKLVGAAVKSWNENVSADKKRPSSSELEKEETVEKKSKADVEQ